MGLLKKLFSRNRDDDFLMEDELWDEDYFYSEERTDSEDEADDFYLSEKEKEMAYGDTKASTIGEFLPVYDNFMRAMSAEITDLDSFKKGMEMIFNQYGETFKKLGVESFGEKGEAFDPNIHNAVMHGEDENLPENSISDVFSTGYKMGDRVIRPAIVKVVN